MCLAPQAFPSHVGERRRGPQLVDRRASSETPRLTADGTQEISDEALATQLAAGHGDALSPLYRRHHRLVLSIAVKILGDMGEAEDLVQSVFLEVFQHAHQFDPERGSFKAWLVQRVYHRAFNRRQHLLFRRFYHLVDLDEVPEAEIARLQSSHQERDARRLLEQSLSGLNHAQSRVVNLAHFEGLTLPEIAKQTGEKLGNVRHHYYRGLKKLRKVIQSARTPHL